MRESRIYAKGLILILYCLLLTHLQVDAQVIKKDNSPVIKDKEHYFLKGIENYNKRNLVPAKEAFTKVLEADPDNDAAYYYLAHISFANKDIASAEMFMKKAVEKDSTNYWYKNMLARLYMSQNNTEKAVETYEDIVRQFPKKTEIYYDLTNLYMGKKDVEKARATVDKIEMLRGKSESIMMAKFNLFRMSNDWDGALEYLSECSKQTNSPEIETILGDLYASRYQDSLAIIHYEKALRIENEYIPAIYGEAELYRRMGKNQIFFKKITPLISNPAVESRVKSEYLGQLLQQPNFVQNFKPQLDTLVDNFTLAHPDHTTATYLASAYFAQTGNRPRCKELLRKISSQNPLNTNAKLQYLLFLYYGKEWDLLEREAKAATENFRNNMDIFELLGISQYHQEKFDEAVATYSSMKEIARMNNDTTAHLQCYSTLGDLYHEIGDAKNAYTNYKKALKIDPGYNPVLNNYAYYLALEGKSLKQAYKMSKKTVESEPDNPTYLDTFAWILYLLDKPEEAKEHLKHAMLYGGTESAAILDHYAEVLYALGEYDLAFIYWEQAEKKDKTLGIEEKVKERKEAINKK